MSDDRWSVYRVGTAAAATTVPGQTPAYGLAYDLATGTWQNADQFNQFARDVVPLSQAAMIAQAQAAQQKALHDLALERARNYESEGLATEDDASYWEQGVQSVKQQFSWLGSPIDSIKRDFKELTGNEDSSEDLYSEYAKAGGLLTEEEFSAFNHDTQSYLTKSADSGENFKNLIESIPDPVMTGLMAAYRGTMTPFNMIANEAADNPGGLPLNLSNVLGSQWFSKDKWSQAWRESEEKSLGNAIVDTVLSPYASEDTLDDWRKNNSLYQFTSFGTEFAAAWYADPAVITSKGVGTAARISKNELPLNETGGVFRAQTQKLQRETVTETNPFVRGVADWRAQRMLTSKENVNEYLKTVSYGEAAALPMAKKRALQGAPIMYALHWANNRAPGVLDDFAKSSKVEDALKSIEVEKDIKLGSQGIDLVDLTWQMGFGDPKAYAVVNKLKTLVPDELEKVAGPGARTFIDAIEATKTKALSLDSEVESLTKAAEGARPGSFHRWEIDTELTLKQNQLNEVTDALKGYEGYGTWLELMGTKAGDKALPLIAQVNSPRPKRWNAVEKRRNNGVSRFFMDNQFGKAHTIREVPRSLYLMKANTASMHDLDSGIMSLNRQAEQYKHFFAYEDGEALENALRSWQEAPTNLERYRTLHEFEETHLIRGAAQHFGVSEDLVRAIFNKVNDERNRTIRGVLSGDGSVYSAAPSLASRVANADDHSVSLLSRSEDGKTVQLQLMDGRDHKITLTLPDAALVERVAPVDITQTPNYYTPVDTRQFYYELKRHKDMLQELDKGWFANSSAGAMESIDTIGTVFNNLWKPAQLWRLGWPQRVLMDEGMRAMAWFGPAYWLFGPGADATRTAVSNIPYHIRQGMEKRRKGQVPLGAGPVTRRQKREADPFARAEEVANAPHIPEVLWPALNADRHAKVTETAEKFGAWKREYDKLEAWSREVDRTALMSTTSGGGNGDPYLQTIKNMKRLGVDFESVMRPGVQHRQMPRHPIFDIYFEWQTRINQGRGSIGKANVEGPSVHDAVTGKRAGKGFIVPISDDAFKFNMNTSGMHPVQANLQFYNAAHWYEKNAEMLARQGMRIVVDPSGEVTVGRWFNSQQRKQAEQFLQYVNEAHPFTKMWDIGKGHSIHVKDVNKPTPFMEYTYREFSGEAEYKLTEGKSPARGVPPVYHGAARPLPENLLPRDEVPVWNGNMIGKGLYTTVRREIAEEYDATNVYTIKGSKSGKTYKVFDLDKEITLTHYRDLEQWLDVHGHQFDLTSSDIPEFMSYVADAASLSYMTAQNTSRGSWANLYEALQGAYRLDPEKAQAALHKYLELKHNAGALTHLGGTRQTTQHQVYVWLRPEDLIVKPVYEKTGKYIPLVEWFNHPGSLETPIPENRIVRIGQRNPMFRELAQIERQLEERIKAVRAEGKTHYKDLEAIDLRRREQDLMSALGLEYRHNLPDWDANQHPGSALISERYAMVHPGRFEQTLNDAHAEDMARRKAAQAAGEQRYHEVSTENPHVDFSDFDFEIDSVLSRVSRKLMQKREYGGGYTTLRSSDGRETVVENAFEGHRGQLFRGLTSSNKSIDVLSEGHGGAMSLARRQAQGHKTYHPPVFTDEVLKKGTAANKQAVMYFQRWADMVNDQIGNSPIWQRMLHGQSDAEIVRWLEETPEGATVRREVMREHADPALWVNEHRAKLNYYLPSPKLQRLLAKGRLEPSDLRKNVHDDDLPDVFGPDLEVLDKRRGMGKFLNDAADKIWTGLGTIPIDALSRHPFAKAVYDMKMRSLIASTDSKWLDAETIARFQEQARQYSMLQVKRTLWDLTDSTNFTDALRFVAPFWGAQQEAITKWLRIISDRPETVARFFNTQRAAYQNFVVIDEDGQPVESARRKGGLHDLGVYHPTDRVVVNIPPFMRHGPLGKALETIGAVGVPIGSANTALQGEMPLMPSPGPMLTIPADKFLRTISDTYGVTNDESFLYRWLFPIGRPDPGFKGVMEQLSPGWGKRVMSATGGEDDVAKANVFMQTAREMYLEAQRNGKPMPSNEDVAKQARWVWALRTVAGLTMPVQTEFRPKNQFFVDAAHKYQREYGTEWFDKFLEDYGAEMASYATSSSNSIVDIPPTSEGMEDWSENKRLIQKYPQWGGAIISPDAYTDDFSYDSYKAQFDISLGPGDNRKLRDLSSPTERFARADERVGWAEFRQFQSAIDAELYARGLHSIQQSGAADLAQLKRQFVSDLTSRHPAWREAYDNFSNDIYSRVNELQQFAFNKEFDNRPDMLGVRQYLLVRDQVAAELDRYSATTGGSRSLQAEENATLREWFYSQVGAIVQANPAFGELYNRYLDGDTLEQGSGGF